MEIACAGIVEHIFGDVGHPEIQAVVVQDVLVGGGGGEYTGVAPIDVTGTEISLNIGAGLEVSDHDALMNPNGKYEELYNSQFA